MDALPTTDSPVAGHSQMDEASIPLSRSSAVQQWQNRIREAKRRFSSDYDAMKTWMDFAAGYQLPSQTDLNDDRYIANITMQMVNQKVAALYARNPKTVATRRERMDYQLWDGRIESLQAAAMSAQQGMLTSQVDMASMALMVDYQQGQMWRQLVERVGKTLEILYKWNCDSTEPDFKKQMKKLVRRTEICGVAYVRMDFVREYESMGTLSGTSKPTSLKDLVQRAKQILGEVNEGEVDESSARLQDLQNLLNSIQAASQEESTRLHERLVFDFPPSRSIIVDPDCDSLEDFIGASWVCQERLLPLDQVNAFFEIDIEAGGKVKTYDQQGLEVEGRQMDLFSMNSGTQPQSPKVCVWEVWDKTTKTFFYLCDGHEDFLSEPQSVYPCTKHFWPWYPLVFNSVETDESTQATIFPPSDVCQMMSAQKEWNRSRQSLRVHRQGAAPRWVAAGGIFTDDDKVNLMNLPEGAVTELQGLALGANNPDINKLLMSVPARAIEPAMYDSTPLKEDTLMTTGLQQSDFGVPQRSKRGETATGASIAAHSQQTVSASNIDALSDLLSSLAENGGQLLLLESSPEVVQRICGPGAVWPTVGREDFVNYIFLEVKAGTAGRPNQPLELANWEKMLPYLIQMGANPQFLVREALTRMDDQLDPTEAFPLIPPQNVPPQAINNGPPGRQQAQSGSPSNTNNESTPGVQAATGAQPSPAPPQRPMSPPSFVGQQQQPMQPTLMNGHSEQSLY